MKKFFIPLLLLLSAAAFAQNINGRFSSSVYSFERFDTANTSETYFRTFQTLRLNVNESKFSIRTRLNFETNLSNTLENDPRLRVYNLYFEARDLLDIATVKLGRQSIINSVGGGVYDGANLTLRYKGYQISGFYGGNVPAYQEFKFTDDWKNDYLLGGKFVFNGIENFRFAASYIDKNFKPIEYTALRLDENFNPIQVLVQKESNQFKFLSGDISYNLPQYFDAYARYEYDLNFKTTSKVEFSGRYDQIDRLGVNVYYNYREPKIRYNSIFSVFNYGNSQEIEGGLDYKITDLITVVGKFGNVTFEDDDSQRLTLGVNSNYGTISYRKTFGYSGELDAISVYTARSFFDGLITPSIGLSYSSYKLSEDSEKNNITAVLAGINYRPWRVLSFDLQGQYFNNKIYENDFRIMFKINHWFNTNLNLL